jgi:transcriptional regulator with XRE-family HTH domain
MDHRQRFGNRLRELRKKARLTQQALGEKADLNYKFLGGIERGEENPSLDVICKLANALEINTAEFFPADADESEKTIRKQMRQLADHAPHAKLIMFIKLAKLLK